MNFFKSHRYAIIWTLCYVFCVWLIMRGLFNFNIFNGAHWVRLTHVRLHGFPGLVFGILLLSALPMYIGTTMIIVRTKKPLFKIPIPTILKKLFPSKQPQKTDSDTGATDTGAAPDTPAAPAPEFPRNMPTELRQAFLRARQHLTPTPKSVFNANFAPRNTQPAQDTTPDIVPDGELPLPTDFDFTDTSSDFDTNIGSNIPVFKDINFDAPDSNITDSFAEMAADTDPEIKITDKYAIATHDDLDFWIADDDTWFATGKTKPSPIAELLRVATEHNVTPVLNLVATNIMDLDTKIAEWQEMGIRIIHDISEL